MNQFGYFITHRSICERCDGSGESPKWKSTDCAECLGKGVTTRLVTLQEALTEVLPDVLARLGISSEVVSK